MSYKIITFLSALIVFETAQQMFFKLSGHNLKRKYIYCFFGIIMYLLYMAIWFKVLKYVPLGLALPIMGLNYVSVALLGHLFFKENIGFVRWCGIILILVGFALVGIGGVSFL